MLAVVVLLCACSREKGKEIDELPDTFAKPITANLTLELVSPQREFFAGLDNQFLVFRLKNEDLVPVTIPDWRVMESDNVTLYYTKTPPNLIQKVSPDSIAWRRIWPDPKFQSAAPSDASKKDSEKSVTSKPQKTKLSLNPGNAALVTLPLPFLAEISLRGGERRELVMKAVMNQKTLNGKNTVFIIKIK